MNEPNLHRIVLINGATSSSKTTIARALRASLEEMWPLAGIDRFWSMPDERFMERGQLAQEGFFWEEPTREAGGTLCYHALRFLLSRIAGCARPPEANVPPPGTEREGPRP